MGNVSYVGPVIFIGLVIIKSIWFHFNINYRLRKSSYECKSDYYNTIVIIHLNQSMKGLLAIYPYMEIIIVY